MNLKTSCAKIRTFHGSCKFFNNILNIFNNLVTHPPLSTPTSESFTEIRPFSSRKPSPFRGLTFPQKTRCQHPRPSLALRPNTPPNAQFIVEKSPRKNPSQKIRGEKSASNGKVNCENSFLRNGAKTSATPRDR